MSRLSNFAKSAATSAFKTIGTASIVIDGTTIKAVESEAELGSEHVTGGKNEDTRLVVTVVTSDLPASAVKDKLVTINGVEWRIKTPRRGAVFTDLILETKTKT